MSSLRTVLFHKSAKVLPALLSTLVLCGGLFSCASSGGSSGASGEKVRVTMRDYKNERLYEVVGESHTNRVEYYSQLRDSASRKIVEDDLADALAREVGKRGFKSKKKPGRAPSQGGAILSWGLEVATASGVEHWVIGAGSSRDDKISFLEAHKAFFDVYNSVFSLQAVSNESGRTFFDNQQATRPNQK